MGNELLSAKTDIVFKSLFKILKKVSEMNIIAISTT